MRHLNESSLWHNRSDRKRWRVPIKQSSTQWEKWSGEESILAQKATLTALAERTSQEGRLDALDLLLREPYFRLDIPQVRWRALLALPERLLKPRTRLPLLLLRRTHAEVDAAVLCLEYQVRGFGTRCFIPFDEDGYRSVISFERDRAAVALEAGEFLVKSGAILALISYMTEYPDSDHPEARFLLGQQSREIMRTLTLHTSFEQTLAAMSRSTRHNLRRSKRQMVERFGAVYARAPMLSGPELVELNRTAKFSTPPWATVQRYESIRLAGTGVMVGLKGADGRWLSVLGAHRESATLCLDWQMNRSDLGPVSVATALRAFLIEDEITRGTHSIRFERGTTHPIYRAFQRETTHDQIFCPSWVSRRVARHLFSGATGGLIPTALASKSLHWTR